MYDDDYEYEDDNDDNLNKIVINNTTIISSMYDDDYEYEDDNDDNLNKIVINNTTIISSMYDDDYEYEDEDENNLNKNVMNNNNTIISSMYDDKIFSNIIALNKQMTNINKSSQSRQYDKNYGFIISRYVHSIKTNHYWNIFNNWKSIFYAIMFTIFVCANETVV